MALICIVTYDTNENNRKEYTIKTLNQLLKTVDFSKHRIVISDNGSCEETLEFIYSVPDAHIIQFPENVGTAKAVNSAMGLRMPGESFIKMDNDIFVHVEGWVDEMEEVLKRDSSIGILGLKRKDLWQHPLHENPSYKTVLKPLPHEPGEKWLNIELCPDIMGSCTMLSSKLIETIGGYFQEGVYGFDDSDMSIRSFLAGFKNAFIPYIEIDHLDNGGDAYTEWKHKISGETMAAFNQRCREYENGTRSLFVEI